MRTKIAFLILAHKDPIHLYRLCRALGPDDDIFVHIDERADFSCFENPIISSNVKFTHRRIPVFWSDVSVVEATLTLIEEAIRSNVDYLRLVLLSGSCYPIKKIEELRKHFIKNKNHLDISYASWELMWAVSRYHFRKPWIPALRGASDEGNRYLEFLDKAARKLASLLLAPVDRGFRRKFPGRVFHAGTQFWSITPECARMILQFIEDHPEFLRYHKYSWSPDEHFFHTIIGNSEFSASTNGIVPRRPDTIIDNLHTNRYPVVTMDHLKTILTCDRFFVRKAVTGKSDLLLDYLDDCVLST
jgi:Core-2/I-Branching enzyme